MSKSLNKTIALLRCVCEMLADPSVSDEECLAYFRDVKQACAELNLTI